MKEIGGTPGATENVRYEIALGDLNMDVRIILKWLNK